MPPQILFQWGERGGREIFFFFQVSLLHNVDTNVLCANFSALYFCVNLNLDLNYLDYCDADSRTFIRSLQIVNLFCFS